MGFLHLQEPFHLEQNVDKTNFKNVTQQDPSHDFKIRYLLRDWTMSMVCEDNHLLPWPYQGNHSHLWLQAYQTVATHRKKEKKDC